MPEPATADATASTTTEAGERATGRDAPRGVRGWLLLLCLMLTVFGPAITVGLMVDEYRAFASRFAGSSGLHLAISVSLGLAACSTAYGMYAGWRLWRIRPGAVALARKALLFGLAVDLVTTAIDVAAAPAASSDLGFVHQVLLHAAPSLVFFTACLGYLNKSARVSATYFRAGTGA
jgi:ABC-type spermidine/putrescine transport system permease subunit II